jgi:hypothetical protein
MIQCGIENKYGFDMRISAPDMASSSRDALRLNLRDVRATLAAFKR